MLRAPAAERSSSRRRPRIAAQHQARRHAAPSREMAIQAAGRARALDRGVPAADRAVAVEPGRADPAPVRAAPALGRDGRRSRDNGQIVGQLDRKRRPRGTVSRGLRASLPDALATGGRPTRSLRHRASGSGRIWNLNTLLVVPGPVSMWKGARLLNVANIPRPFQPPFGSSIRPSIHLV